MFALTHLRLPTRPHRPPHPPPSCPPPIDLIRVITAVQKTASKTRGVQMACGISYEILAT